MTHPKTVHILLIEDNSGDVLLFTEMLAECPGSYEVKRVERLSAALELLAREAIDLVVMDLNLPDADGVEALHRLRERYPLPVIVLSGSYSVSTAERAFAAGVTTFLVKGNISPEEIHAAIMNSVTTH